MTKLSNEQRLTELETKLTYLQKDYESLNEHVLENTKRLEEIKMIVKRLVDQQQSSQQDSAPRNLEDEKPPHY
ncbi:MAG: SlyX family protein [Planctomycetota bacterium]